VTGVQTCALPISFFWQATQDVSTALTRALSRAGNGEPKTHHLKHYLSAEHFPDDEAVEREVTAWF
jgi:hypothetical protein